MFCAYRKSLVIAGIVFCLFSSVFAYSGGDGTEDNPYLIYTAEQINNIFTSDFDKCFKLMSDIDMSAYSGDMFNIIGDDTTKFTGTFDGNGHIIRNLNYSGFPGNYVGLFGCTLNATIKNLGVENVNINSRSFAGGLVGYQTGGTIKNCYSTGSVSSSSSYNAYAGGLVGKLSSGSITNCYSTVGVSSTYSDTETYSAFGGGLVGEQSYGTITNCCSTGEVTSQSMSFSGYTVYSYAGGMVGSSSGTITNCYSTGSVASDALSFSGNFVACPSYAGGLVGYQSYGSITNCYSTGFINPTMIYSTQSHNGGLVGELSGSVVSSFWDVNTSGQTTSAGGTGKTTAEMQDINTFLNAGWDFSYIDGDSADWFIQIDEYPILTWQISPADIYTDGKNNFRDFAVFTQYWMREDCAIYNYYCDWADLDFNGSVDIDDLVILMSYWLQSGIYN